MWEATDGDGNGCFWKNFVKGIDEKKCCKGQGHNSQLCLRLYWRKMCVYSNDKDILLDTAFLNNI